MVFDNNSTSRDDPTTTNMGTSEGDRRNAAFFIRILRYLETPQYLRKHLIPRHSNLRCVVSHYHFSSVLGFAIRFIFDALFNCMEWEGKQGKGN